MNTNMNPKGPRTRRIGMKLALATTGIAAIVTALGVLGSGAASAATRPTTKTVAAHAFRSVDTSSKDRFESSPSKDRLSADRLSPDRVSRDIAASVSRDVPSLDH